MVSWKSFLIKMNCAFCDANCFMNDKSAKVLFEKILSVKLALLMLGVHYLVNSGISCFGLCIDDAT